MSHEFDDESYTGCECEQCVRVNAKHEEKKRKEAEPKDAELLAYLLHLTNISRKKLEEAFIRKGSWDRGDEAAHGEGLLEAYNKVRELTTSEPEPLHERMKTCRFCGQFPCPDHSAEAMAADIASYTKPCRIHGETKEYACNECYKGPLGEGENDHGCAHGFEHWGLCPICNVAGLACTPRLL